MERNVTSVMLAVLVSAAIFYLTGCGSGSSSTITPPPSITSFVASPSTIQAGASSSLTGVFSGGSGVITPGNIAATSDTAVSVSPSTTTTYTLTVTSSSGSTVTAQRSVNVSSGAVTATVTVDPSNLGGAVTDQLLGMNL